MPLQLFNIYVGVLHKILLKKNPWLKNIPERSLKLTGPVASEVPSNSKILWLVLEN